MQLIKIGELRHEKRELVLPLQLHFAGTAWEGDECDKFLAMWLQQRQTGRGRARKGQPTEPRTSFASPASPIFLGVVVAVGELRADTVKGVRWLRDQRWLVTWWIKFQFWTCTTCDISFDLFNRTLFRANSRESCTLYCPHRYSLLVNNTACSPTPLRGMRFVCTLPGPAFSPAFACFTHNEFTPDQITWNHEWTRARIPAYRGNGNEEKHTIMSSQEIAR